MNRANIYNLAVTITPFFYIFSVLYLRHNTVLFNYMGIKKSLLQCACVWGGIFLGAVVLELVKNHLFKGYTL